MALDRVQATYQTQLLEYGEHARDTIALIKKLKEEKQRAEDSTKLGVGRIRAILVAWKEGTKRNIDNIYDRMVDSLVAASGRIASPSSRRRTRKKAGDNFYKMDEESIVTIREELSDNFFSLADTHLEAVRRLIERLNDDKLGTQLQFERYVREHQQLEAEKRILAININDEEQPEEQPNQQPKEVGAKQPDGAVQIKRKKSGWNKHLQTRNGENVGARESSSNNNRVQHHSNPWIKAFWTYSMRSDEANHGFDVQCTVPRACHNVLSYEMYGELSEGEET